MKVGVVGAGFVRSTAENMAGMNDVTLSLPRIVGGTGVQEMLWPPINNEEESALRASVVILRKTLNDLDGK